MTVRKTMGLICFNLILAGGVCLAAVVQQSGKESDPSSKPGTEKSQPGRWPEGLEEKLEKIKEVQRRLQQRWNSPEWQERLRALQERQNRLQERLESQEFQEQMRAIERLTEPLSRHFQDELWQELKRQMQELEDQLEEHFNSPEWKQSRQEMEREIREQMEKLMRDCQSQEDAI